MAEKMACILTSVVMIGLAGLLVVWIVQGILT
jgi:hypothetical protein